MDSYLLILGFGFVGLLIMAVLGAAGNHSHHHAHGTNGFHLHGTGQHGLSPHTSTHFHHTPLAHAQHTGGAHAGIHHGHASGAHAPPGHASGAHAHLSPTSGHLPIITLKSVLMGWLSPRVAFTFALGFGATGALLHSTAMAEPWRALCAAAGGVLLEKLVVAPLWNTLLGFGSTPARTLESAVFEEAVALTNFDREGCGLVSIDLDGHEMRVLGRLTPEHRGVTVRSGTPLLVEDVDAARGACTVSPLHLEDSQA